MNRVPLVPFSLLIFDYDGVLIDSLAEAITVGIEYCRSISHERVPTKDIIEALDPATYDELARSIGLSDDRVDKFCSYVFDRFQAISPSMAFFPEIDSLLHRNASKNLAIVSGNAKNVIAAKLAVYGLAEKITCIQGAFEPGNKTQKILNACWHFRIDRRMACMIGDSASDIRYAKQAGVQSIAVTWGWQSHDKLMREKPDFIVRSVQELASLIDSEYSI